MLKESWKMSGMNGRGKGGGGRRKGYFGPFAPREERGPENSRSKLSMKHGFINSPAKVFSNIKLRFFAKAPAKVVSLKSFPSAVIHSKMSEKAEILGKKCFRCCAFPSLLHCLIRLSFDVRKLYRKERDRERERKKNKAPPQLRKKNRTIT